MQQVNTGAAKMSFVTTATSVTFSVTKTGATLVYAWSDGTFTATNSPTKSLPAGTKRIEIQSRDGWKLITYFDCSSNSFSGTLPSFGTCTSLATFYCDHNSFSGTLPSFGTCTSLATFYCGSGSNSFSGTLPSFGTCTSLATFYCGSGSNSFSGTLPSFGTCTSLANFHCNSNSFSGVVSGSFSTQQSLSNLDLSGCALSVSAVDSVLADCVTSLGISGRVACTISLAGGTNAAPDAAGLANKATLVAAGWTVTTN
jgi:hypothetical protein